MTARFGTRTGRGDATTRRHPAPSAAIAQWCLTAKASAWARVYNGPIGLLGA